MIRLVTVVKNDEFISTKCYITLITVLQVHASRLVTRLASKASMSLFRFLCCLTCLISTYFGKISIQDLRKSAITVNDKHFFLNFKTLAISFPLVVQGGRECWLHSVQQTLSLLLLPPEEDSFHFSPAPASHPSHSTQSSMNFSSVNPFHRQQSFVHSYSMCPLQAENPRDIQYRLNREQCLRNVKRDFLTHLQ